MKKLKLDLDALEVDSFDTLPAFPVRQGTVRGYATDKYNTECCTAQTDCWGMDCGGGGGTGLECETRTAAGETCNTTGYQIECDCTNGGAGGGTCNATCDTCMADPAMTCQVTCGPWVGC